MSARVTGRELQQLLACRGRFGVNFLIFDAALTWFG